MRFKIVKSDSKIIHAYYNFHKKCFLLDMFKLIYQKKKNKNQKYALDMYNENCRKTDREIRRVFISTRIRNT